MLRIGCEFLHGVYRGSGSADLALAGSEPEIEWPPSPARLFAALVAAGEGPDHVGLLQSLEAAAPPTIDASSFDPEDVTPLVSRYVVLDKREARSTVQEYPLRRSVEVRPGTRLSPRDATVTYWWDVDLDDAQFAELRRRCARVPYLGTSDSPVRMNAARSTGEGAWKPADTGSVILGVPSTGYLDELTKWHEKWKANKEPVRRSWITTRREWYAPPWATGNGNVEAARLYIRLGRPVAGRFVRVLGEALRNAAISKAEEILGSVPPELHGHAGTPHARFLPLPSVGFPHADGRIRGACVVLPAGISDTVLGQLRLAIAGVERLWAGRAFDVAVTPFDGSRRPWSSHPERWERPATKFATATPFVHERFSKKGIGLSDLTEWCRFAGLPDPVAFAHRTVPLIRGAVNLMPHEVYRSDDRRPYGHLFVEFSEEVRGPVSIGRLRHFGLGLLVPLSDDWRMGDG